MALETILSLIFWTGWIGILLGVGVGMIDVKKGMAIGIVSFLMIVGAKGYYEFNESHLSAQTKDVIETNQ